MEIDPRRFITELLGQKIQATAENRMNIGIFENTTNRNIYRIGNFENHSEFQAEKQLWLFPQFNIGISLRDQDLASLSKQKNRAMLYFILVVDLFFIASAFLVFRTIRKEVRLAQIKSDFISNVSHEIRTPLALISMYAETLEMNRLKSEDKKKEYYRVIFGESKRLSDIVNRILNFSKLESGKRTFNFSNFDLNELVEKIMLSYEYHLNIKGFAYQVELFQQSILIHADFEALSDAFINLLDNSIKYSPVLKSINVRTGIEGGFGFFEIADKGIGIAREHHKLIFDKFFRVAKGNTAYMAKGTGLGLTIVKNIVDAHQGKIEVSSKLNEGSVFRVLIPINK
ncbi:MAG: HAMP domain-containing histidine kinase [Bacteroidetes bacterium]|nr:HAMP domain-containing histidine kinase [Bacteroidota bacterium]